MSYHLFAQSLGVPADAVEPLLRRWPMVQVRNAEAFVRSLAASENGSLRVALRRAMNATDAQGQDEAISLVRRVLEGRSRTTVADAERALIASAQFGERWGERVGGEFVSRYTRALGATDPRAAQAEITLADDILEGRTPFGRDRTLESLSSQGDRVPEYRVGGGRPNSPRGLAEVKVIGGEAPRPGSTLIANAFERNLHGAFEQIEAGAEAIARGGGAAVSDGFIRIDARFVGAGMSEADILHSVNLHVSNTTNHFDRFVRFTRWIEVFYNRPGGRSARILIERRGMTYAVSN